MLRLLALLIIFLGFIGCNRQPVKSTGDAWISKQDIAYIKLHQLDPGKIMDKYGVTINGIGAIMYRDKDNPTSWYFIKYDESNRHVTINNPTTAETVQYTAK